LLAKIIRLSDYKDGLDILTNKEDCIQVLTFNYRADHNMRAHKHIERHRTIQKTQEALVVLSGRVEVTTLGEDDKVIDVRILESGDTYVLFNGGVGYKVLKNGTKMLEIKPGHYLVTYDDEDRVLI